MYADGNLTAPHADSVAVVHHNTPTNAVSSGNMNAPPQQGNPMYTDTFEAFFLDLDQPNGLSNGSHAAVMRPGSGDITAHPSSHAGGQN